LYIFADEDIIESTKNVQKNLCQVEKRGDPVIVPDKPWEGALGDGEVASLQDPFYGVVLYDAPDRRFRCWYNAYNRFLNRANFQPMSNQGSSCGLATSTDGINWDKPAVRQVLYDGSYDNNMVRFMDRQAVVCSTVLEEQVWSIFPFIVVKYNPIFASNDRKTVLKPAFPRYGQPNPTDS